MKYLFKAEFLDGTTYEQHPNDLSIAGEGFGSSFSDIIERVRNGEVKIFSLISKEHTGLVDLQDGHFEVDGLLFEVSSDFNNTLLSSYRLIYFRRVRQCSQKIVTLDNELNPNVEDGEMTSQIVGFRIGWQANDESGKNYQQILEIK